MDASLKKFIIYLFVLQRLWFKTNLKLCKIWFDMGEYGRMSKVLFFRLHQDIILPLIWIVNITNLSY